MVKMEIELTDEQFEKVEILKSHDVDVGQAIDLLFGLQDEITEILKEEQGNDIIDKITDAGFDSKIKQELLKKNYDEEKTYDVQVQEHKHTLKWSDFFKL